MSKKTVAVIFGGCSTEYEVSLQSSYYVIKAIDREKYDVLLLGISRKGNWYRFDGNIEDIQNNKWMDDINNKEAYISPSRKDHGITIISDDGIETVRVDAVFPVLHGKNGEDGSVQGLCSLAGIPVVGCDMLASAICMDKDVAHRLVSMKGIRVPESVYVSGYRDAEDILKEVKKLSYPLFVKPVNAGSSFGISKVYDDEQLVAGIKKAYEHDSKLVIEENIDGFEVGCAVMGNDELTIGEVDEIELSQGFFDYTEKYTLTTSKIHMPARISDEDRERVKQVAATIYKALGLSVFARVDMFFTPDKQIVFNEVNSIPGFTSHSRFPNMMKGIGLSFEEVIDRILGYVFNEDEQ